LKFKENFRAKLSAKKDRINYKKSLKINEDIRAKVLAEKDEMETSLWSINLL
jgi:hypothetical protein